MKPEAQDNLQANVQDIRDIKPLLPGPFPWDYVAMGLAAALVLFGLWHILRRYKRKEKLVPKLPPFEQAMADLRTLESQRLLENGEVKAFFFRLSEILRHYIEGRFSIPAVELTSEELRPHLLGLSAIDDALKGKALRFFERSDVIKFANARFAPENLKELADSAYDFVVQTKPTPEPPQQTTTPASPAAAAPEPLTSNSHEVAS